VNGYEIIRRCIEFDHPPRVGLRFSGLGVSDVLRLYTQMPRALRPADSPPASMRKKTLALPGGLDEWGCQWETLDGAPDADMGQVVNTPLADWAQFDSFAFPDPSAPGRFDGLEEALAQADGRYVQLNSPFCMFERMHFLRGMETLFMDLIQHPAEVERLADRVIDFQIGIIEEAARLGQGRIHCFDTTDDWGTQRGLMIRPAMWRAIFKPRYRRLVAAAHQAGMHVRFHTDGKVNDILEDLAEIGVDFVNIHQPRLLGIEEIGARFNGRLCFEASVDIQATLPTGDRAAIEEEVQALLAHWGSPRGGLIGVEYRNFSAIGSRPEYLQWELDAFLKYGTY